MKIALVGGVFDDQQGRASGYVRKLHEAITAEVKRMDPEADITALNGGRFSDLQAFLNQTEDFQALVWMGDIPNDKPKLVSLLKEKNHSLPLMISKNNRADKYSVEDLQGRMQKAGASLLLEFKNTEQGTIKGRLLRVDGSEQLAWSESVETVGLGMALWLMEVKSQSLF